MEYKYDELPWTPHRSTYHAHPKHEASTPTTTHSLRELLAKVQIEIQLRGLPGADRYKATDVYCPEIRRSPVVSDLHVSHLDVVSCWKGLAIKHASEIVWWEILFQAALEKMVLGTVLRSFAEHVRDAPDVVDESTVISSLVQFTTAKTSRLIDIDVAKLVDRMIHGHYETVYKEPCTWFHHSPDLSSMVYNFVRTRDCFLDSYPFPCLEISFSHDQDPSRLCLIGDVDWQPPVINFDNLPVELPAGAEYRVTPRYQDLDLGSSFGPRFTSFVAEPTFYTSSKTLPLVWDENLKAFRATIPNGKSVSASKTHEREILLERVHGHRKATPNVTTFTATIVRTFPENIRFEQTTRYTLKLDVRTPPKPTLTVPVQPLASDSGVHYIASPSRQSDEDEKSHDETFEVLLSPAATTPNLANMPWNVSTWLPSYSNTPVSKCGRNSPERVPWSQYHKPPRLLSPRVSVHDQPSESRNTSLCSIANTDEVKSQVDELDQNRSSKIYTHPGAPPSTVCSVSNPETGSTLYFDRKIQHNGIGLRDSFWYPDSEVGRPSSITSSQMRTCNSPLNEKDRPSQQQSPHLAECKGNENAVSNISRIEKPYLHPTEDAFRHYGPQHLPTTWVKMPDHHAVPQKRKATKQVPTEVKFKNTSSILDTQRLALDRFEHVDLQLAAKKQRLGGRLDSGFWDSGRDYEMADADACTESGDEAYLSGMGITTGVLGDANGVISLPEGRPGWLEKLSGLDDCSSHLYSPTKSSASDSLPRLRKSKNFKRTVVHRRSTGAKALKREGSGGLPASSHKDLKGSNEEMACLVRQLDGVLEQDNQTDGQRKTEFLDDLAKSQSTSAADEENFDLQSGSSDEHNSFPVLSYALWSLRTDSSAAMDHDNKSEGSQHSHDETKDRAALSFRDSKSINRPGIPFTLDQEEIQRNYTEFKDRKTDGKEDLDEAVAKEESKAFERIFLMDDSQEEMEWESESLAVTVAGSGDESEQGTADDEKGMCDVVKRDVRAEEAVNEGRLVMLGCVQP